MDAPVINTTNPKDLMGDKKVDLNQVSPFAIAHEACAMMDGTWKYGYRNWREKEVRARIYIAAAKRHLAAWEEGEENAEDSDVHHLGHARACLGILLDAQETGNLVDDRVKSKGQLSQLLNRLSEWVEKRRKFHQERKEREANARISYSHTYVETLKANTPFDAMSKQIPLPFSRTEQLD